MAADTPHWVRIHSQTGAPPVDGLIAQDTDQRNALYHLAQPDDGLSFTYPSATEAAGTFGMLAGSADRVGEIALRFGATEQTDISP